MEQALYRKYRPKTFAEVIGQNHIKTTLLSELESDNLAHAYLFSGPRGLGKTTTARLLAKAVNCLNRKAGNGEPCNKCEACLEIINGRALDVLEIDAASHTGVDNVRENIIENSRFTPTSRKFKVFIIDEVHMLSASAFNALLKTLEEPPAHAMFILATTEIHKVPETIISRCQHFDFRKVSNQEIIGRLNQIVSQEKKQVDKEVLENIAYFCQGGIRDAESLLGQILALNGKHITLEQAELVMPRSRFDLALQLLELLNQKDASQSLTLVNNLVEDGVDLEKFTADVIEVSRKMMLLKISSGLAEFGNALNKDLEKQLASLAEKTTVAFLVKVIEVLISRKRELRQAEIPQLPLELAILEIIGNEPDNSSSSDTGSKSQSLKIKPKEINTSVKSAKGGSASGGKSEVKVVVEQVKEEPALVEVEPIVETIVEKVSIKMHQVKSKWPAVLEAIKQHNQSLSSTLKISKPDKISDNGTLVIYCPNKFLQSKLIDTKNSNILEKVLQEIFGVKLIVEVKVDAALAAVSDKDAEFDATAVVENKTESIDTLLNSFGGQVVE